MEQGSVDDGAQIVNTEQDTDFVFEIPAKDAWKKATLISKLFLRYSTLRRHTHISNMILSEK